MDSCPDICALGLFTQIPYLFLIFSLELSGHCTTLYNSAREINLILFNSGFQKSMPMVFV